ncbi:hypothetical protein [Roseibium sp. M-1]
MSDGLFFRFVKTPGNISLPAGISRQYQVFQGAGAPEGDAAFVFDLEASHMRGLTHVRQRSGKAGRLVCQSNAGGGSWTLVTAEGESLARLSGPGLLASSWKLERTDAGADLELRDPAGLGKQIVRTMLNGDTEGLALLQDGVPIGAISRRHREEAKGGGGLFAGLKRFVVGRDWVLSLAGADTPSDLVTGDGALALAAFSMTAIVGLELSSAD